MVKFMKCLFNKTLIVGLFVLLMSLCYACKKDMVYNEIDAFSQIENKVIYDKGQYILSFSLAVYPYQKVQVYLHDDLAVMYKQTGGVMYNAENQTNNRYAAFFNPLVKSKTYYYQVIVFDKSENAVRSNIFKFVTQP